MDLLLIFISIAGVVFAGVMLLLASRTTRMERESDARVQELLARATGSVLFVPAELGEPDDAAELPLPQRDVSVAPLRLQSHDDVLDLAWDQMRDESSERVETRHPFVLTVPSTAGDAQVVSFARTPRRSRT